MDLLAQLEAGEIKETLAHVQDQVRKKPGDPTLRIALFELLSVMGEWERCFGQLDVLREMSGSAGFLGRNLQPVVHCELLRCEVFSGKRRPLLLGDPDEWVGWLVQAMAFLGQEQFEAAATLRDKALEAAPETPGTMGTTQFKWIADLDPRLAFVLELIMEGKYYWVPFSKLRRLTVERAQCLRHFVWCPVSLQWINEGSATGFVPTRYPGTETSQESALLLASKTEWTTKPAGFNFGLGVRRLVLDTGEDVSLLKAGTIRFTQDS